jgi:hypothetical protein
MTVPLQYYRTAELPATRIWWRDAQRTLVPMSTAAGFTVKVGRVGETAMLTKTTGVTGAAGSGTSTESTGSPNVQITWASSELNLTPGRWTLQVTARFTGSKDRVLQWPFYIKDVVA